MKNTIEEIDARLWELADLSKHGPYFMKAEGSAYYVMVSPEIADSLIQAEMNRLKTRKAEWEKVGGSGK